MQQLKSVFLKLKPDEKNQVLIAMYKRLKGEIFKWSETSQKYQDFKKLERILKQNNLI